MYVSCSRLHSLLESIAFGVTLYRDPDSVSFTIGCVYDLESATLSLLLSLFCFLFFFGFFLLWLPCSIWNSPARDQIQVTVVTYVTAQQCQIL